MYKSKHLTIILNRQTTFCPSLSGRDHYLPELEDYTLFSVVTGEGLPTSHRPPSGSNILVPTRYNYGLWNIPFGYFPRKSIGDFLSSVPSLLENGVLRGKELVGVVWSN